eukprot:TRINITY_DN36126_c0_g1_i1.p1 TRINITY_DN36126_c0_g1~~TRINITY_DN36126_c0_g1_i1.p1  ORF type:complete len:316 (+),score=85.33 TRINITY_DN36126_c0_g1_i1:221-1168(+)
MAGRGRMGPQMQARPGPGGPQVIRGGPQPGPGPFVPVQMIRPPVGQIMSIPQVEQKLHQQHGEIQRLLIENQRLAATHIALRQELAESQRMQQSFAVLQGENRMLKEKCGKLEADVRSSEPLKAELMKTRSELQNVRSTVENERNAMTQQLQQQLRQLQQDNQLMLADIKKLMPLQTEVEGLRQELTRARAGVEFERKANADLQEQKAGMENNLVAMARDVEKLKAQLSNAQRAPPIAPYTPYTPVDTSFITATPPAPYTNGFSVQGGTGGYTPFTNPPNQWGPGPAGGFPSSGPSPGVGAGATPEARGNKRRAM